jgi:hypothetical protein
MLLSLRLQLLAAEVDGLQSGDVFELDAPVNCFRIVPGL